MCKFSVIFAEKYLMMAPKWIFFDLDDTLFDFTTASFISLCRLWDESPEIRARFDTPDAFLDEYHIHNKRMWQLHECGQITADFLKGERFRLTVAPDRNDESTVKAMRLLNDRYLWLLGECDTPVEGAKDLLSHLSHKHLIGVLTNGFTEAQYRKLHSTGLDRYIQRMVISDEIGIQKPDPRIFRYAEQETGATPDTTIMIGDNPDNDIQGALDAGWQAIYLDRKSKPFSSTSPLFLGKIEVLADCISYISKSNSRDIR
ncbi:MAG: YjjG family noncanonical pyrimidine nucleotidase [Muribaculaceae bacterium]|nr:YjjG family noncanonical pyrimidine nucleotidase [Muribaculaceae bacterium]